MHARFPCALLKMADSSSSSSPAAKKRRLSLSLRRKETKLPSTSRFTVASTTDVAKAAEGVVPENTARVNAWALKNFELWVKATGEANPSDPVPQDILHSNDPVLVCKWLCKFVLETRQESGKPYPPKSLYSILCGLYRVCRSNGVEFNFLDKKDARFASLHKTMDSVCSNLHAQAIGASTCSAMPVSIEDENALLDRGVLAMDNPSSWCFILLEFIVL